MQGTSLTFRKRVQVGTDAFNNPRFTTVDIVVDDCLIAPISEPTSIREQQALDQDRDQVRIHLPKAYEGDVSGSEVTWFGKIFSLDSDSVVHMAENTPTRWNRYFRAEFVANYQAGTVEGLSTVFYGTNVLPSIDSSGVTALQETANIEELDLDMTLDGDGAYLYFAYPVSFGVAKVSVNGFFVTAWQIELVQVTVTLGLVDYYVYRSQYKQHGTDIHIKLEPTS